MPFPSFDVFKLLIQESEYPVTRPEVSVYCNLTETPSVSPGTNKAHRAEITMVCECPVHDGYPHTSYPDTNGEIAKMLYNRIKLDVFGDTITEINDIRQRISSLAMINIYCGDLEELDKIQASLAELSNRLAR